MAKYRNNLPQLSDSIFLTDGGLETCMIFHEGVDLPLFAAFSLLENEEGRDRLRTYYERYIGMATARGIGFILEGPTWRASPDWGERLGYSAEALAEINRASIRLLAELREKYETTRSPMVISGTIGPRGDGYDPGQIMSPEQAEAYHAVQIGTFRDTDADLITAFTITNVQEAIGITRAAQKAGMPVVISFTLETDGRLPTGQKLEDAIRAVDSTTGNGPAYYMVNCAHPTHFAGVLESGGDWIRRVRGIRANASKRSHAELDNAPDLDAGDPVELGRQYRELRGRLGGLTILGGCCGTDHRHVEQICLSCLPVEPETVPAF
jgi:S-methylmethionine-dependent homocysteine/selenocysteine methylase